MKKYRDGAVQLVWSLAQAGAGIKECGSYVSFQAQGWQFDSDSTLHHTD